MEMDQLVALCKRRGFLFQSSEIYGGLQGFWDYGPLGVELKRNVREAWWRDMVTSHNELEVPPGAPSAYEMVGLDCSIIMHPQVWKCSGHYDLFHDFMVDCRESKKRYRYDQVCGRWVTCKGQRLFMASDLGGKEGLELTQHKAMKFFNLRGKDADELAWDGPLVPLTTRRAIFRRSSGPDAKTPRHADRTAGVQPDVQDDRRRRGRRRGHRLPSPRDRPGTVRQLQERLRQHAGEDSLRHRPDGQELSQRDHAAELHLPLAGVRADGDRVLLPSRHVARVVSLLARPAVSVVSRISGWRASDCGSAITTRRS